MTKKTYTDGKLEQADQPNSIHSLRSLAAIGYPGRYVMKKNISLLITEKSAWINFKHSSKVKVL